ncbi:MAG TPA: aldo/keto reductase [Candidatus Hydrogenedentes bacterium]|nr:aldo/keto reductase [Candidatus Hydrogenedentota bacterium]HOL78314.1 aldo/keto reductase [Candidatus Hydrogenedentota bacterium]HPO87177.1 aldo/keto reductase [Candidatus Hydrogenedentota bacterium]
MRYRILGSSDLNVSVISFGAWQIGDPQYWGSEAEDDPNDVIDAAIEAGINLFDTAEWYGNGESERVLGKVIKRYREKVYIASKVSPEHCAPKELRKACENSLKRLDTDYIDLYQVHWPFRHVPFEEAHTEMERLKQEGKIRFIGVSNFGKKDLTEWMKSGTCVSNQLGYNLLFRAIEIEILPECIRQNIGVLAYMPLMQGLLTGRWNSAEEIPEKRRRTRHFSKARSGVMHSEEGCEELTFNTLRNIASLAENIGVPLALVALAWLIGQPGVSSVIVGARRVAQLLQNIPAADLDLSEEVMTQLNNITQPLKEHFGNNADMWRTGEDARIH